MGQPLEDGKYLCDKCDGFGVISGLEFNSNPITCPKCQGECILDWVELVVGKKPNSQFDPSFVGTIHCSYEKPENPIEGHMYTDLNTNSLYIYFNNQWNEVHPK